MPIYETGATLRKAESPSIRLLGLGNELLADDAFGILVAREVARLLPHQVDVACSSAAGFNLMDSLLGASHLVVVDTVPAGAAGPGTVHVFDVDRMPAFPCAGPHFLGLAEVLAVARQLNLNVPKKVVVIAVEAADCTTIGGEMNPKVRSAVTRAVDLVRRVIADALPRFEWAHSL
jgi:hydrogenase maturation protease